MLQVAEGQQRLLKLAEEAAGVPVPSYPLCTQYKTIRLEIRQRTLHVLPQSLPQMGSAPKMSRAALSAEPNWARDTLQCCPIWKGCLSRSLQSVRLRNDVSFVLCADSKPKVKALTLSQIEARIEDPTIALKQLLKEHK